MHLLGRCRRFRLVSFRDNDVWVDHKASNEFIPSDQKSVSALLSQDIPNHERQAALAAQKLGECVFDGMEAVTLGLAKRGVVQTYSMIEGCAKELGCTVILRVRVVCFIERSPSTCIYHSSHRRLHVCLGCISTSVKNGETIVSILS